jgi:hypothetical protein
MESSLRQKKERALLDRLSARKLLKVLAIIPFMWNYRKEDLHRLLGENYYLLEQKNQYL